VLGQEGGWDVSVAWCPDERATALRCVAMWMSTPDQLHLFETATWQRRQAPTTSAVGRAAAGGHSHWIGDLTRVDDAQLAAAAGEGMRAALHVPMRHGGETSGVLELLTHAPITPNPEIAAAMEAVALQLAHFEYLLRRGAEPRWRLGRL
jgi:GAF domain-containing protein